MQIFFHRKKSGKQHHLQTRNTTEQNKAKTTDIGEAEIKKSNVGLVTRYIQYFYYLTVFS